jgi:hypothetical protein
VQRFNTVCLGLLPKQAAVPPGGSSDLQQSPEFLTNVSTAIEEARHSRGTPPDHHCACPAPRGRDYWQLERYDKAEHILQPECLEVSGQNTSQCSLVLNQSCVSKAQYALSSTAF